MSGFTQIGVGSSANDGTGDALRVAFQALNGNYSSTVRSLASTTDLATEEAASGYVRIVEDLSRGGVFKAVNGGTPDGGTIFSSATAGWTWQRQYNGAIHASWFGSDGDAVQAAINAANPTYSGTTRTNHSIALSAQVLLGTSDWLVTGKLRMRDGVELVGESVYGSRLNFDYTDGSITTKVEGYYDQWYKGEWDSGTAYIEDDIVLYSGEYYQALSATTNDQPDVSTDEWREMDKATENPVTKNFSIKNLTMLVDYDFDPDNLPAAFNYMHFNRSTEPKIHDVRCIMHNYAAGLIQSDVNTQYLGGTALRLNEAFHVDLDNFTVDGGGIAIFAGDGSGRFGMKEGRIRNLFGYGQKTYGLALGDESNDNLISGIEIIMPFNRSGIGKALQISEDSHDNDIIGFKTSGNGIKYGATIGGDRNKITGATLGSSLSKSGTITTDYAADSNLLTSSITTGLVTRDEVEFTTTGTLPAPLQSGVIYYAISNTDFSSEDGKEFHVATTPDNASAGTAITLTDDGSGTHTWEITGRALQVSGDDNKFVNVDFTQAGNGVNDLGSENQFLNQGYNEELEIWSYEMDPNGVGTALIGEAGSNRKTVLLLDGGTSEYVNINPEFPKSWNGKIQTTVFFVNHNGSSSGDALLRLFYEPRTVGQSINVSGTSYDKLITVGGVQYIMESELFSSTFDIDTAADDHAFRLGRIGADGSDTYSGDLAIMKIVFKHLPK